MSEPLTGLESATPGELQRGRRGARVLAQSMMLAEEGLPILAGQAVMTVGVLTAAEPAAST